MSKIGRNDLCPCGSGKKYKHCHLKANQEPGNTDHAPEEMPLVSTFDQFVQQYDPVQLVSFLGALQLYPLNHGRNVRLEEMARLTLLYRTNDNTRPTAYWEQLKSITESYTDGSHAEDEPTTAFTENAVFAEGNYIVYPGLSVSGTEILNQLMECIFLTKNELPGGFKKKINDGVGFLLFLSNSTAGAIDQQRGIYEQHEATHIVCPEYETVLQYVDAIRFSKEYARKICTHHRYDETIASEFILPFAAPELKEEDPDKNIVLTKPLIETEEDIILYMPTVIVGCLIDFVYQYAKAFSCYDSVLNLIHDRQFHKTDVALSKMGWQSTNIELPADTLNLPIKEAVYQFDNQKLGYVCFIEKMTDARVAIRKESKRVPDPFAARSEEVVTYLVSLTKEQPYQVLCLYVIAETGHDYMFAWSKPPAGHLSTAFKFSELNAIAYSDGATMLTLWKFAKTYSRTNEISRIMAMGGTLDAYAIYESNRGSLLHSDTANPIGGTMMILAGSSNDFLRKVELKKDEHAVSIFHNATPAFAKVTRYKAYAPIYTENEISKEFRLVIESFDMPIWITHYPSTQGTDPTWAKYVCEGIAFWLFRMKEYLQPVLQPLTFIQFEIEVIVDEELLNASQYEEKEVLPEDITITLQVEAPRIQVGVPFDFLYLVRRADNAADKVLMTAVLKGLRLYVQTAGSDIDLPDESIQQIITLVLQPAGAKMFLFSDASSNVRLDDRGLPPMRYIDESDISYVLDNITRYLPKGYVIPKRIIEKKDKIKLCNDVVGVLIGIIETKIKQFDGPALLKWLIRSNEKCIQLREFREILLPAKIACFSSLDAEVQELVGKDENLASTSLSLRTLIEFVATRIPSGKLWPNFDDIDELLALISQVIAWGTLSDAIWLDLSDPEMGLLPSGRIGTEKKLEKESLAPYSEARTTSEVFQYIEDFEKHYVPGNKKGVPEPNEEVRLLDEAFREENGITLTSLSRLIGVLINEGFTAAAACVIREKSELIAILQKGVPELSLPEITSCLQQLTLLERSGIGTKQEHFEWPEIYPWRYKRQLSYLKRPLVNVKNQDSKQYYYYGYRHLMVCIDNLYYLLYTGKYPNPVSPAMKRWLAGVSSCKGGPFRAAVKEWFQANTGLTVIEYEVHISPKGHLVADRDYGDIDLMVIDHPLKRIYSIECKNIIGGRNIYEMASEIKEYLGKGGNDADAKISKHYNRDQWLQDNKQALIKFVTDPESYTIRSLVLTADELPLAYLKKHAIPLPVKSFPFLRKDGVSFLKDL